MPQARKDFSEERKNEIIQAAWRSFQEKGYEKTTIREIAKSMSSTTGFIYYYFESKEEILEEMQARIARRLENVFDKISQTGSARDIFKELVDKHFKVRSLTQAKKVARGRMGMLAEALRSEGIRKLESSRFHQGEIGLSKIFAKGIENGEIQSHVDPKAMAGFYIALRWGLRMQLAIVDDLDVDSYLENFKKILFGNTWIEEEK